MTQRVDLDVLVRATAVPSPMVLHGTVAGWLEAWRRNGRRAGTNSIHVADVSVDLLDALRSPMLLQGADALAGLYLLDAVDDATRSQPSIVRGSQQRHLARLSRLHQRAVTSERAAHELWHDAKATLYPIKRELERFIDAARGHDQRTERNGVLMVVRQHGHLTDLIPVADSLQRHHGIPSVMVTFDKTACARAGKTAHGAVLTSAWAPPLDLAAALGNAWAVARRLIDVAPREHKRLLPDELETLRWSALRVLANNLSEVVRTALGVSAIIKATMPRAIIVANPYTLEGRVAGHVSQTRGIRTFAVEHGTIFANNPFWVECPVDVVCAWGESSRDVLATCGVPNERIVITGAPRMDATVRAFRHEKRDRPSVLVGTSGAGGCVGIAEHREFIETLFRLADETPELDYVVKLHPKDGPEHYEQARRNHVNARVSVVRGDPTRAGEDIFDFLRPASALLTISSTCALDAMLVGVPVVVSKQGPSASALANVPYLNSPCAHVATDVQSLKLAIRACVAGGDGNSAARAYIGKHFANAGNAAEVVADTVARLTAGAARSAVGVSNGSQRGQHVTA